MIKLSIGISALVVKDYCAVKITTYRRRGQKGTTLPFPISPFSVTFPHLALESDTAYEDSAPFVA